MVCEVSGDCAEPVEIPGGVAGLTEKNLAHIIVDAVDLLALVIEMFHGFRADESAGTGNQNCLWLHLKGLLLSFEVGRSINIMRQIPRICIDGRVRHQPAAAPAKRSGRTKLLEEAINRPGVLRVSPVQFQLFARF